MNKKRQIFYTREYRHMKNTPLPNVGKILFTLIPFYIILLICYDDFTYWLSDMAGKMLNAIYGVNYYIEGHEAEIDVKSEKPVVAM